MAVAGRFYHRQAVRYGFRCLPETRTGLRSRRILVRQGRFADRGFVATADLRNTVPSALLLVHGHHEVRTPYVAARPALGSSLA